MDKLKDELKKLSAEELENKINEMRKELFNLRLQKITKPLKDKHFFKNLRKNIARGLTYLNQKSGS